MPYLYIYTIATGVIVNLTSGAPNIEPGQAFIARIEGVAETYGGIGDTIRFRDDGSYYIEDTNPWLVAPAPAEEM